MFIKNTEDFNTEDYDHIAENRFLEVGQNPLSTFSIDVDAASYSNMRRFINNGQVPPADAVRIEEMVNYFNYEYPQPTGEHPFEVVTEISDCPWNSQNKLLHIITEKQILLDNGEKINLDFRFISACRNSCWWLHLSKLSLAYITCHG